MNKHVISLSGGGEQGRDRRGAGKRGGGGGEGCVSACVGNTAVDEMVARWGNLYKYK